MSNSKTICPADLELKLDKMTRDINKLFAESDWIGLDLNRLPYNQKDKIEKQFREMFRIHIKKHYTLVNLC